MSNESPSASSQRFSPGSFFLGLVLGAVAGAAAGLLLAPKSGAETLGLIQDRLGMAQGQASKVAGESSAKIKTHSDDFGTLVGAKLALLRQAFEAGKQAARNKHRQLSQIETIEAAREQNHG